MSDRNYGEDHSSRRKKKHRRDGTASRTDDGGGRGNNYLRVPSPSFRDTIRTSPSRYQNEAFVSEREVYDREDGLSRHRGGRDEEDRYRTSSRRRSREPSISPRGAERRSNSRRQDQGSFGGSSGGRAASRPPRQRADSRVRDTGPRRSPEPPRHQDHESSSLYPDERSARSNDWQHAITRQYPAASQDTMGGDNGRASPYPQHSRFSDMQTHSGREGKFRRAEDTFDRRELWLERRKTERDRRPAARDRSSSLYGRLSGSSGRRMSRSPRGRGDRSVDRGTGQRSGYATPRGLSPRDYPSDDRGSRQTSRYRVMSTRRESPRRSGRSTRREGSTGVTQKELKRGISSRRKASSVRPSSKHRKASRSRSRNPKISRGKSTARRGNDAYAQARREAITTREDEVDRRISQLTRKLEVSRMDDSDDNERRRRKR